MTRHLPHPPRFRRLRTTAGVIPSGAPTVLASIVAVVMIGPPLLAGSGVLSSRGPHPVERVGDAPASAAPAAWSAAPTPRVVAADEAAEVRALVPRSPAPASRNARTERGEGTGTTPADPTAAPAGGGCQGERRGEDRACESGGDRGDRDDRDDRDGHDERGDRDDHDDRGDRDDHDEGREDGDRGGGDDGGGDDGGGDDGGARDSD